MNLRYSESFCVLEKDKMVEFCWIRLQPIVVPDRLGPGDVE